MTGKYTSHAFETSLIHLITLQTNIIFQDLSLWQLLAEEAKINKNETTDFLKISIQSAKKN